MTLAKFVRAGAIAASALVISTQANAADIYAGGLKDGPVYAPAAGWTGFYAGFNGGYAWAGDADLFANSYYLPFNGLAPQGGFFGGQIGYNVQGWLNPRLVVGIEADIQGSNISDSSYDAASTVSYKSTLDYFGTLRGRLGYAFDRTLVYATGGLAFGGLRQQIVDVGVDLYSTSAAETGYVVGAGVEYRIAPAWSIKAEYQYIDLGNNNPVDSAGLTWPSSKADTTWHNADNDIHTFRVGLNYHVGSGYEPLK